MNLPSHLKFCERFVNPFVLQPDWWSMVRTGLWFMAFMLIAHIVVPDTKPVLPHETELKDINVVPVATTPSDLRYVRLDMSPLPPQSYFWVAGSSIALKETEDSEYTFFQDEIQPYMPEGAQSYVSVKMGQRLLDNYTLVLDAIERKPEAIIVTLNPFWLINDSTIFFKTNVMNHGARTWLNKTDWPLYALLTSPGNILWGVIGHHHKVTANGYDYLKLIVDPFMGKKKKKKKKTPTTDTVLEGHVKIENFTETKGKLSYDRPLVFWVTQRMDRLMPENAIADNLVWQEKALSIQDTQNNDFSERLLANMFKKLEESGIPALLYIPPVSPDLRKTDAYKSYENVVTRIKNIAHDNKAANITFIGDIPDHVENTLVFRDHLHLQNSGKLPEFLGSAISDMMTDKEN